MGARIIDVTAEEYHRDPCAEPSLSASLAKVIVDQSPAHARLAHPRMGGVSREPTKAMDTGSVLHRLVLGKGGDFAVLDFADYRTKAAQAARDAARAEGKTPILAAEAESEMAAAEIIKSRLRDDFGITLSGRSEVAVEWREPVFMTDNETVQCRCMFDHVFINDGVIYDLKKTRSANPVDIARATTTYGYDIQHAAYTSAFRHLRPDLAGREKFVFLFVEDAEPYAVTPVRLTGAFRELGDARWSRAVRRWHQCITSGKWPAYATGVVDIEPTPWALASGM